MKFTVRSLWALGGVVGLASIAAFGIPLNATATPPVPAVTTASVTSPVVGPVVYDCKTQSLGFSIAYPDNHVTVAWTTPDGGGISASFAVAKTASFNEPMVLTDGSYTLGVTEYPVAGGPGIDFSQKFTVKCVASPSPTVTTTTPTSIHKSYVCKFKKAPGGGETLQTGQNPIWVDNHALLGYDGTVTVGQEFKDAQGRSVVVVANTAKLSPEPSRSLCPAPVGPPTITPTPTATETPSATETPTATETPSATETPTATTTPTSPKPSETVPTTKTSTSASSSSSSSVAVAVATCSAGQVVSGGKCVVPTKVDTGPSGIPGWAIGLLMAILLGGGGAVLRWRMKTA